jgi:hypothetical protein
MMTPSCGRHRCGSAHVIDVLVGQRQRQSMRNPANRSSLLAQPYCGRETSASPTCTPIRGGTVPPTERKAATVLTRCAIPSTRCWSVSSRIHPGRGQVYYLLGRQRRVQQNPADFLYLPGRGLQPISATTTRAGAEFRTESRHRPRSARPCDLGRRGGSD